MIAESHTIKKRHKWLSINARQAFPSLCKKMHVAMDQEISLGTTRLDSTRFEFAVAEGPQDPLAPSARMTFTFLSTCKPFHSAFPPGLRLFAFVPVNTVRGAPGTVLAEDTFSPN